MYFIERPENLPKSLPGEAGRRSVLWLARLHYTLVIRIVKPGNHKTKASQTVFAWVVVATYSLDELDMH